MRHRRSLALIALIVSMAMVMVSPRLVSLWDGWVFLIAFENAVTKMGKEGSVACVEGPIVAAEACKSKAAVQMVDERCLDAFRKQKRRHRAEVIIAYYVLTETRDTLSNEMMVALKELAADPETNNSYLGGDLDALIEHFEGASTLPAHIGEKKRMDAK